MATVDKVGLGIDLLGGQATLAELRDIRAEMQGIVALASGTPGGSAQRRATVKENQDLELSSIKTIEAEKLASLRRIAQATAKATAPISGSEVSAGLAAQQRRTRLKTEIALLNEKEQADFNNYVAARRQRIRELANQPDILSRDLSGERASFKRYRGSSARDEQTDIFRKQLAEEIQAQRVANREKLSAMRKLEEEQIRAEASMRSAARAERIQSLSQDPNILDRNLTSERNSFRRYRNSSARDAQTNAYRSQLAEEIQAQRIAQRNRASGPTYGSLYLDGESNSGSSSSGSSPRISVAKQLADEARAAREYEQGRFKGYSGLSSQSSIPNSFFDEHELVGTGKKAQVKFIGPAMSEWNPAATKQAEVAEASFTQKVVSGAAARRKAYQEELKANQARLNLQSIGNGRSSLKKPPGGGGGDDEDGGSGGGAGGLGVIGRITRNFILYRALGLVTTGTKELIEKSLEAAKASTEQGLALRFATEAANGNLEANRALARQIGETTGMSQTQALQTVAVAARAAYRDPSKAGPLAQVATNIAALRGGGLDKAPEILEDIIGGRDRKFREYFNITPEQVYKEAAQKKLDGDAKFGNVIGRKGSRDYETEQQRIAKYVSALSEEEKEQLRLNYAIDQSFRFEGDAAIRAATLAGKMDAIAAATNNAEANFGKFIATITPVKELMDGIIASGKGGGIFATPELAQSGPRSTVTGFDIAKFGRDNSTGSTGSVLTSRLLKGALGVLSPGGALVDAARGVYNPAPTYGEELSYRRNESENLAIAQQQQRLRQLRAEGQTGFRSIVSGQGDPTRYFTREELQAKGAALGTQPGGLRDYIEEIKPELKDGAKDLDEYNKRFKALTDLIDEQRGKGNEAGAGVFQGERDALERGRYFSVIDKFKPKDYDTEAAKRHDDFLAEQERQRAKNREVVNERAAALAKLRDASAGSFKLVGDIANTLTGPDNDFTRILSDQITSAERMRQQWGFLGDAAVKYFDTLEQKALARQLNQAEFGAYTKASGLLGNAAREAADRGNVDTLSRRDQEYLNIQEAIVNRAKEIPNLWRKAAEVLGQQNQITQAQNLNGRLNLLFDAYGSRQPEKLNLLGQDIRNRDNQRYNASGQPLGGYFETKARTNIYGESLVDPAINQAFNSIGAGQPQAVKEALRKGFADSIVDAFQGYTPQQIRASGYQDLYVGAIGLQANSLQEGIDREVRKSRFSANEDARLSAQLNSDDAFRAKQLAAGRDPNDVGRESDRLLLSRTEGINPKDLTYDQFQHRQEAQRREAERTVKQQEDAAKAVAEGLAYQQQMQSDVALIRAAILGGDINMLIQVQNDTQARVDKNDLDAQSQGTTALDQRGVKSSAYTPSTVRYARKGGTGLTNR